MGRTIKDVAARAGVSVATVSNVINNTRYVSDDLREKVQEAIREVGYHPNVLAPRATERRYEIDRFGITR